jgi:predicted permease
MAHTLVRYGVGRTKQFQVSGGRFSVHQLAPLVLLAPVVAAFLGAIGMAVFSAGWLLVALLVGFSAKGELNMGERLVTGLAAPLVPIFYAWGQLIGWFSGSPGAGGEITVVDEKNQPAA